jgi:AcrR family transcriptional regulator
MTATDRRIRRTQKLLGSALIALALERGYENITIQDVTERADIGYRTYFRHYSGLDELSLAFAKERLEELYLILGLPEVGQEVDDPVTTFLQSGEALFRHIQKEEEVFRALLLDNSLYFILDPIMRMACQKSEELLSGIPDAKISASISANHIIASVFALMRWWLENNMPHPPEKMGEIYTRLIIQPTWLAMTSET